MSAPSASASTRTARPTTSTTSLRTPRQSASSARTTGNGPRSRAAVTTRRAPASSPADLPALEDEGRAFREANPDALAAAVAAIDEEDLFTFIYTSGTTGPPKGCMIRHRNYYAMVAVVDDLPDHSSPDDVLLLYLPLAHNFGRLMHLSGPYVGYTTAFRRAARGSARAPQVRPTVLPSVPRIYEKVHTAVTSTFADATGVKRRLVDWALDVGRRARVAQQGQAGSACAGNAGGLADRLVFSKVKERLGGRLRTPISGGAPLAKEVAEFFDAMGICILEGYGLTECTTAASTNTTSGTARHRWAGVAGLRAQDRRRRRAHDPQRDHLRRYRPRGDRGRPRRRRLAPLGRHRLDRRGRVRHDHRPQEGHNRDRRRQEHRAAEPRERPQDLTLRVAGDRCRRSAALPGRALTLDPVEIGKWASRRASRGMASLARDPRVVELVQGIVDDVNRERSRFEQLKRFVILPRDFEMEQGEVTPDAQAEAPRRPRALRRRGGTAVRRRRPADGVAGVLRTRAR